MWVYRNRISPIVKPYPICSEVKNRCDELKAGEIVLLENLRFHPEETGEGGKGEWGCGDDSAFASFISVLSNGR